MISEIDKQKGVRNHAVIRHCPWTVPTLSRHSGGWHDWCHAKCNSPQLCVKLEWRTRKRKGLYYATYLWTY